LIHFYKRERKGACLVTRVDRQESEREEAVEVRRQKSAGEAASQSVDRVPVQLLLLLVHLLSLRQL